LLVEDPRLSEAVYDFQQEEAYISVWNPPKADCQADKGPVVPYFLAKVSVATTVFSYYPPASDEP